jgi:FkbM family methyltransferase
MSVNSGIRVRIRGLWFHVFLRLSFLARASSETSARRLLHFLKLLPYRPRFSTKDVVQCVVGDNLFLTHLKSSSSPEHVMKAYKRFFSSLEEDDVVIDVGAHVGAFSVMTAKRLKNGLVISFEPNPDIYRLLKFNVYLNGLRNVIPLNVALADFCGKTGLVVPRDPSGGYLAPDVYGTRAFDVQVKTLDAVCLERGIERVNFIKIHAEGSEIAILKGARNILVDKNLSLVISSSRLRNCNLRREICKHLLDIGFKPMIGGSPSHPTLYARKGKNRLDWTVTE